MTLWEAILYNPFTWILILLFVLIFWSWFLWWFRNTFRFEGSWKKLDKSIHWKDKKRKWKV